MARQRKPLTPDEIEGIITAAQSVFRKAKNLYLDIAPRYVFYGFTRPSPGVVARQLSELIEEAIVQHCLPSFTTGKPKKGRGRPDIFRLGDEWEVKIHKGGGLFINQSKVVAHENYIVVNYNKDVVITHIWVLWLAQDDWFSPRQRRSNGRTLNRTVAAANIEMLYERPKEKKKPSP